MNIARIRERYNSVAILNMNCTCVAATIQAVIIQPEIHLTVRRNIARGRAFVAQVASVIRLLAHGRQYGGYRMNRTNGFVALLVAGAGLLAAASLPASAFSVPVQQQAVAVGGGTSDLLLTVRNRHIRDGNRHNRHWNRRLHGPRCTFRRGNCNQFYGGYYYANPWWLTVPLVGGGYGYGADYGGYPDENVYDDSGYDSPAYGNSHVRWCMERYRSYNARYNTWVSYDGDVRQCVSPYS